AAVRARVAGRVADRAALDTRRIREEVAGQEELRVERQAEARGAAAAVRRADGVGRHRVDDTQTDRRGGRVRNRERRAEQTADARAVPVAARLGRGQVGEGQARPAARRHPGERAAHVGDGERQRYAGAPAAGVEAAAGEVLEQRAGARRERAAVSAPDTGREVQPGRADAAADAARRRGGGRRSGGGRGRQRRVLLGEHVGLEVVYFGFDRAVAGRGAAVGFRLRLGERRRHLRPTACVLRRVGGEVLRNSLRVDSEHTTRLFAGRLQLGGLALARQRTDG